MTYLPDSVLVEALASWLGAERGGGPPYRTWENLGVEWKNHYRRRADVLARVACPLVAGVIADRLDEETGGDSKDRWAAEFVRSEFVDGEA